MFFQTIFDLMLVGMRLNPQSVLNDSQIKDGEGMTIFGCPIRMGAKLRGHHVHCTHYPIRLFPRADC